MAFCALLMCAESYFVIGSGPDFVILVTVFFATLFIYNAAQLKIVLHEPHADAKQTFTISGGRQHIMLCALSIVLVFAGLAASHYFNILIFLFTAALSVFYMMPFAKNGKPVKGFRNHLILKNVVLSLVWAFATVTFPLATEVNLTFDSGIIFMFLRRFFFIYALTVVYDIRDIHRDELVGMKTLAVRFGDKGAKAIALVLLLFFVVFIAVDPVLNNTSNRSLAIALYISAFVTAMIIAGTTRKRGANYYSYVIDGSMVVQFVLVALFAPTWH